jgi:DNA polymerase-3 subunit delta'
MPFSAIIGHDRPVAILKRALANEALAHALLFSGEEGIGKRMTALALAAALNCGAPGPDGGCGVCAACRKVAAGSHPDVHLLAPETDEIKIDQVRRVQEELSLKAFEGRRKVLIVDGAEAMNDASSNSFLKTLEEPPGDTLIVLVTARPRGLLPTIRSRCQELQFLPLPRHTLAALLRERRGLSEDDAWFLAALSRGSIGRALAMDAQEERKAREQFLALMDGLGGLRRDEVLSLAEGIAKDREGFERLLDLGVEWLRDRMVYFRTGDERLLVFPGNIAHAPEASLPRVLLDLELFADSRRHLERRASAQLVAENLLLRLGGR